jgi:sulfide dehydrogenase [flavocytochrome c] flavoprotein chain
MAGGESLPDSPPIAHEPEQMAYRQLNRREFIAGGAALASAATWRAPAIASAKPKVVVVGGGPGGGSIVRALASAAPSKLDIILIEAQPAYAACFQSNLHLGGLAPIERYLFTFDAMRRLDGVTLINDAAIGIDRDAKSVALRGGARIGYDLLVVAAGIDLDYGSVPGWSKEAENRMPHAYKGGAQLALLKSQLDAAPDGAVIVIMAPPNPYRCPPGPYERASMMAHAFKAAGKSKMRIVILDEKEAYPKQALFEEGWRRHYPGMIEWMPRSIHGGIKSVDPATMTVETDFETYSNAALVNVIPRQMAGAIARDAGLVGAGGYCPIDPYTMKSMADPRIFVVGDACISGDMSKAAFAAGSQAKVAAQAILAELFREPKPEAKFESWCWSLIDAGDSVKLGGSYAPTPEKIQQKELVVSQLDDAPAVREANFANSISWYESITRGLFLG